MTPQDQNIPYGFCHCGCKKETTVYWGKPRKYLHGHNGRSSPEDYIERDMGFKTQCWIWNRHTMKDGYGRKMIARRVGYAHVWYFEQRFGKVPDGLEVDHLCRVRNCVNPEHMEAVTPEINNQRRAYLKMTPEKVTLLRKLRADGVPLKAAALQFGITPGYASEICCRTSWRNVV